MIATETLLAAGFFFMLGGAICFILGHMIGFHRGLKSFCRFMARRSAFSKDEWYQEWLKHVK